MLDYWLIEHRRQQEVRRRRLYIILSAHPIYVAAHETASRPIQEPRGAVPTVPPHRRVQLAPLAVWVMSRGISNVPPFIVVVALESGLYRHPMHLAWPTNRPENCAKL